MLSIRLIWVVESIEEVLVFSFVCVFCVDSVAVWVALVYSSYGRFMSLNILGHATVCYGSGVDKKWTNIATLA